MSKKELDDLISSIKELDQEIEEILQQNQDNMQRAADTPTWWLKSSKVIAAVASLDPKFSSSRIISGVLWMLSELLALNTKVKLDDTLKAYFQHSTFLTKSFKKLYHSWGKIRRAQFKRYLLFLGSKTPHLDG